MKRSKQFFYQVYSNYDWKFAQSPSVAESSTMDKFQTFQGFHFLPKQFKDFFRFLIFKDFSRVAVNSKPTQERYLIVLFHKHSHTRLAQGVYQIP